MPNNQQVCTPNGQQVCMPNGQPFAMPADMGNGYPPQLQKYLSKPVDAPIEKPNVIKIEKAKIAKPTVSAEEALVIVMKTVLPNFNKSKDFFEQGLTSLDTIKIVTRCGENGYKVELTDIYKHPKFKDLVKVMKPGE